MRFITAFACHLNKREAHYRMIGKSITPKEEQRDLHIIGDSK